MIRWIESLSDWDRTLPAALVGAGVAPGELDALLHALAARALGCAPEAIEIRQEAGRAPVIARPPDSGLHLSKGSRGDLAAVAVADGPVGVDVEGVEPDAEIPWNVLHHAEAAMLRALEAPVRARAFARLWSLKEAYLKALGTGLSREPASFAVTFLNEKRAAVDDAAASTRVVAAETVWRSARGSIAAISAVLLVPKS